jgi:hypothetical protein
MVNNKKYVAMSRQGTSALQSTALSAAVTSSQQIDLSPILNAMIPMMIVAAMVKTMGSAFGKPQATD